MHFNCRVGDAHITGNLFVQLAGDDMLKEFPLARCERAETAADFGNFGRFLANDSVSLKSCANRRKQIFVLRGLGKEIKRALFHRLHTLGNITVAGEKNNRQYTALFVERSLKLKAVELGHGHVKDEASGDGWIVLRKKFHR